MGLKTGKMQLSKLENRAYEELKRNNLFIFTIKDFSLLLKLRKTKSYNLIKALKRKKAIKAVGRRHLAFSGVNELALATAVHFPSYLSFWTALNYYGYSDQTPKTIFLATTRYTKENGSFRYVTLSRKCFFGYQQIGGLTVAEREKAFVDSLLFPKYAGGIREISRSLQAAFNEIDVEKLIVYVLRTGKAVIISRLGFLLERLGGRETILKKLKKRAARSYQILDPTLPRKGKLNKTWHLVVNDDYFGRA